MVVRQKCFEGCGCHKQKDFCCARIVQRDSRCFSLQDFSSSTPKVAHCITVHSNKANNHSMLILVIMFINAWLAINWVRHVSFKPGIVVHLYIWVVIYSVIEQVRFGADSILLGLIIHCSKVISSTSLFWFTPNNLVYCQGNIESHGTIPSGLND